jgi:hypothetical protein
MSITKESANYVAFAMEPFIRAEVYSQLRVEKIVERVCGVQANIGQKRIVSVDQNNKDFVVKLAYESTGIFGNACEYLCYTNLLNLRDNEQISDDDLLLFAKCELVNGSPLVVRQEFGSEIVLDPEFQRWLSEKYPEHEDKPWLYASEWIFREPKLREDANRIQQILSDFFVASDVHVMQEPKNFALRYIHTTGGRREKRLMLIDMDSCFPIINDGEEIRPVCPICGSEMVYVPNVMRAGQNFRDIENQTGVYTCTRDTCANNVLDIIADNGYAADNQDIRDNNVFRKYIEEDNVDMVQYMLTLLCYSYTPLNFCRTITDYRNEILADWGQEVLDFWGDRLFYAFNNYQNAMVGTYLAKNSDVILKYMAELMASKCDFADFANGIIETIPARVDNDPISKKLIATLYVIGICADDVVRCCDLLGATTVKEFADAGEDIFYDTDMQNISEIFNWISIAR